MTENLVEVVLHFEDEKPGKLVEIHLPQVPRKGEHLAYADDMDLEAYIVDDVEYVIEESELSAGYASLSITNVFLRSPRAH